MNIYADKTNLDLSGIANLQGMFFDKTGAQIVVPYPTSPFHITWSVVSNDVSG